MDGSIDAAKVEAANRTRRSIAYITAGSSAGPCVLVPPGGGALKEVNLLWIRDLAALGGLFVVAYDLRGTGGSESAYWRPFFEDAGTDPTAEMDRVSGKASAQARAGTEGPRRRAPLDPSIVERLGDFDGYATDAITVLDELQVSRAHVMGLSQGGFIAQLIAMQHPDRILSCVSCSTVCEAGYAGMVMAAATAEGQDFADRMRDLSRDFGLIETSDPSDPTSVKEVPGVKPHLFPRDRYSAYRGRGLEICVPGFPKELYAEVAEKEYDGGVMSDEHCNVVALKYEAWERAGKRDLHQRQLRENRSRIPILYVHGKKDGVIHLGQAQQLFAMTANSVLELHDYGHNFGPPDHQRKILGRVADFMKQAAREQNRGSDGQAVDPSTSQGQSIGTDTHASGVSANLGELVSEASTIREMYDAFCSGVQTAADTEAVFDMMLAKLQLQHLRGCGLKLFLELKSALEKAGLNFKQKKLLSDLDSKLKKTSEVVAGLRAGQAKQSSVKELVAATDEKSFNNVLVCGAGPVGLRAACELALLGFRVRVVEKRPNFSRANILTFWDETMNDMLGLGAKSFFPNLSPSGSNKFLGTRQIQVCLLKALLLLGGDVRYGFEIHTLCHPEGAAGAAAPPLRWSARLRPYARHRRRRAAEAEAAAEAATEFQKAKDYVEEVGAASGGGKVDMSRHEAWEVDDAFISGKASSGEGDDANGSSTLSEFFDAYVIAEGSWSNSTGKLGFHKFVETFSPSFGLVINMKYNPADFKEKQMKTCIHFCLSKEWPLRACPIQAEFIEYLKGETHFFALVVSKKNIVQDDTDRRIAEMKPEARAALTEDIIALMRRSAQQKGLVEMGVFREAYASGKACLAPGNVDAERLFQMARAITVEMGLPAETEMYETNPVQLFDFSRRARCVEPVRVLRYDGASGCATSRGRVQDPEEYLAEAASAPPPPPPPCGGASLPSAEALILPVGDALQEPNWTQGLGVNRGFHTAMNQAYALLVAREKSLAAGIRESRSVYSAILKMKWGQGHSGLAGSGSGNIGLKPYRDWNTDPRTRLPCA